MIAVWIVLAILVLLVLYVIVSYNSLVRVRDRTDDSWSQIDVQLRRRYDLIPNLVETVKGYAAHERQTFEAVTDARARGINAQGVAEQAQAENMITGALKSLFAVAEAYPELKANQTMLALHEELASTENRVAFARQAYNDAVMEYNTGRETFPASLVAGAWSFQAAELLQATESADERRAPRVSFS
jgi:LemA protein